MICMSQKTNGDDLTMTFGVSAITKREYFAGVALHAYAAQYFAAGGSFDDDIAGKSVILADKLIDALNKPQAQESEVSNG